MKVLRIDPINPDQSIILEVVRILRSGGVIIYPTDTCYGLGADPNNQKARQRVIKMKQREEAKKFSVIAKDIDQIETFSIINQDQYTILKHYLPGTFTFILLAANLKSFNANTIGVRIPDHPFTKALANLLDRPFISTSANLGGHEAIYSYKDIQDDFLQLIDPENLPDLVLDAGELPKNPPSTVVDLVINPPFIIRQGGANFTWPI